MPVRRPLAVIALAGLGLAIPAVAAGAPGDVTRASLPDTGSPTNTQPAANLAAMSADGHLVAFTSAAALTAAPTGGKVQLYVRDLLSGHSILASREPGGGVSTADVEAGDTIHPFFDVSGDGRFAVWGTLVGAVGSVYRTDLATGQSVLIDTTKVSPDPNISYDGNRIAYRKTLPEIVVGDVAAGTTTTASVNDQGVVTQGSNGVEDPAISADGNSVAFEAVQDGHGLVGTDDAPGANDIIVRNLVARTTQAASLDTADVSMGGNRPDISGDGRYVVFQSGAKLDAGNDANATGLDIYRRDLVAGTTKLISAKTGADTGGNAGSSGVSISADGNRVAFTSDSTDLIGAGADNNAVSDVFVRDVGAGTTQRVSTQAGGAEAVNPSLAAAVSPNGGRAAFTYSDVGGHPLLTGDTNLLEDVFATELGPSDTAGPAVTISAPAEGAVVDGAAVQVSGAAGDPSGVGALTVAGQPVAVGAGGAFTASVPLGAPGSATSIAIVAHDGSGNATALTRTVSRPAPGGGGAAGAAGGTVPPTPTPATIRRPAVRGLSVSVIGGRLRVRFTLAVRSKVRVEVLRSRRVKHRLRLVVVGRPVVKTLAAGTRTLTLAAPRAGSYRVRVTATAGGRAATTLKSITVRRR